MRRRRFVAVLERQPHFAPAFNGLALIARRRGDRETAAAFFAKAVEYNPANNWVACDLGHELRELGRLDEAEATYRKVIERQPHFPPALNGLAQVARKRGAGRTLRPF